MIDLNYLLYQVAYVRLRKNAIWFGKCRHRDIRFNEEKAMQVSLGRKLELHADDDILAHKVEGPHIDVE